MFWRRMLPPSPVIYLHTAFTFCLGVCAQVSIHQRPHLHQCARARREPARNLRCQLHRRLLARSDEHAARPSALVTRSGCRTHGSRWPVVLLRAVASLYPRSHPTALPCIFVHPNTIVQNASSLRQDPATATTLYCVALTGGNTNAALFMRKNSVLVEMDWMCRGIHLGPCNARAMRGAHPLSS